MDKALSAIRTACAFDCGNSRYILEQDQLFAKAQIPVGERLAELEKHRNLIEDRDTLCIAYIKLLNLCGKFDEALTLLENHTFHVWEGGEGKVAEQYKLSLFAIAEREFEQNNFDAAAALCERTLTYPDNLGEGKLFNVPDNRAYYTMGLCCKMLGRTEKADEYFRLATQGGIEPEPVRYYNDQPSDYIYYIGLACKELGQTEMAKRAFESLVSFGKEHIKDRVSYDFFAVSMPELEVYQDDIQKRNDDYCKMLIELGEKGLKLL